MDRRRREAIQKDIGRIASKATPEITVTAPHIQPRVLRSGGYNYVRRVASATLRPQHLLPHGIPSLCSPHLVQTPTASPGVALVVLGVDKLQWGPPKKTQARNPSGISKAVSSQEWSMQRQWDRTTHMSKKASEHLEAQGDNYTGSG